MRRDRAPRTLTLLIALALVGVVPPRIVLAQAATAFTLELASIPPDGGPVVEALRSVVSADGSVVAFTATLTVDGPQQVFVRDRRTGTTELVTAERDDPGTGIGSESHSPSISADGRYVAFVSPSFDLAAGPECEGSTVYVRDRLDGDLVAVDRPSEPAMCHLPSLSGDGTTVAFATRDDGCCGENDEPRIWIADATTGSVTREVTTHVGFYRSTFDDLELSADGSTLAYAVLEYEDGGYVRVIDLTGGASTELLDVPGYDDRSDGGGTPSLSDDGRFLAYTEASHNDIGFQQGRVMLWDRDDLAPPVAVPLPETGDARDPTLSADGSLLAFSIGEFVDSGESVHRTVWLHDVAGGTSQALNRNLAGDISRGLDEGSRIRGRPDLSADGTTVVFDSDAEDLVAGDTANHDIFVAFPSDDVDPVWPVAEPLRASEVGASLVRLEWEPASDDVGVTRYELELDGAPLASVGGATTSYDATGLEPATMYTFTVRARDAAGNRSDPRELVVTTLAAPVAGSAALLVTGRAGGLADLHWDVASPTGLDGYRVLRAVGGDSLVEVGETDETTTSFTDTGLDAETTYRYVVQALRGGPEPHTVEATVTTPPITVTRATVGAPLVDGRPFAALGSDLTITLRGEPNRDGTATVSLSSGDEEVSLSEGPPGTYVGHQPLTEGAGEVTAVVARLADGAGHFASSAVAGLPLAVSGALAVNVDAPAGSLNGARATVYSESARSGGHGAVAGGDIVTMPLVPATDHRLQIVRSDGRIGAVRTDLTAEPGVVTHVSVAPTVPAQLSLTVLDGAGALVDTADVRVTDATTGTLVASGRALGGTVRLAPLDAGTAVDLHVAPSPTDLALHARPLALTITLLPGENAVTVPYESLATGRVVGTVAGEDGGPLEGAQVTADQDVDGRRWTFRGRTGPDGTYAVDTLAGAAQVRASRWDGAPDEATVEVPPGGEASADLTLTGPQPYDVVIEVLTQALGGPVEGPLEIDWRVAVHLQLRVTTPRSDTGTWGVGSERMRVLALPGEVVRVCADGAESGMSAACGQATFGAASEVPVQLTLVQAGRIDGVLVGADGALHEGGWQANVTSPGQRTVHRPGAGSRLSIGVPAAGDWFMQIHPRWSGRDQGIVPPVLVPVPEGEVVDVGTLTFRRDDPFERGGNGVSPVRREVPAGGLAQLRTIFENTGATTAVDAVVRLPVPDGTTLEPASVTLDGVPVAGTAGGDSYDVPLGDLAPGASGTLFHAVRLDTDLSRDEIVLATRMDHGDPVRSSTVGAVVVRVSDVTIEGPRRSATHRIAVSGRAPAGQTVTIAADEVHLGTTEAGPGGTWQHVVELPDHGDRHTHVLVARATVDGAPVTSAALVVEVDSRLPRLLRVSLGQTDGITDGRVVSFDPAQGVARFPFVVTPTDPLVVEAVFDRPELVTNVVARIGNASLPMRRLPDRFRATLRVSFGQEGPIHVDYDVLPGPVALPDVAAPTETGLRERLPSGLADFEVEEVSSPPSTTPSAVVALPGLGAGTNVAVSMQVERDLSYTPTADDLAAQAGSGLPVYGITNSMNVGSDTVTGQVVAFIPESALPDGDAEAGAVALAYLQASLAGDRPPSGMSTGARIVPAQASAAVPVARIGFEFAFQSATTGEDLVGALTADGKYDRLSQLLDRTFACSPGAGAGYRGRLDVLADAAMAADVAAAALMFAGVVLGPATFGLGTLAVWAVTFAMDKAIEYRVDSLIDRLANDMAADEECHEDEPERPDPLADPVWIYDPSGFVYEGVTANRVPGVTATLSQAPAPGGPWAVWDATFFEQANPLTTDDEGRYAWDVPPGFWQVAWTAPGYETGWSPVLEVLPPHTDVDHGIVSLEAPQLDEAAAIPTGVTVTFTQYLRADDVEAGRITVADAAGAALVGVVTAVDAETAPDGRRLARTYRFLPDRSLVAGEELTVTVDELAINYAGRIVGADAERAVTVGATQPSPGDPNTPASPTRRACPAGAVPPAPFSDVPAGGEHTASIACLAWWRIIQGVTRTTFGPGAPVTRGQMATMLVRVLEAAGTDLPTTGTPFSDIATNVHASSVRRLAAAGVADGFLDGTFRPAAPVTRGQLASFLVRAHRLVDDLPLATDDRFRDDDASVHEPAIDRAAAAGLVLGIAPGRFAPQQLATRAQMASLLVRTLDRFVAAGAATPPATAGII